MGNKISVLSVTSHSEENVSELCQSFINQSYLEKELLIITDENIEEHSNLKVFPLFTENIWESYRFLLEQATGDFVIFMHPNEYFYENHSLSKLMDKRNELNAQVIVCSYVKNKEGTFYYRHYGDNLRVSPIYKSGIAILMNRYMELRKLTGVLLAKETVQLNKNSGQLNLYDILCTTKSAFFDTNCYYVIPTNKSNSLNEQENNEVELPLYVQKEFVDNQPSTEINFAICVDDAYGKHLIPFLYSIHQHHEKANVYMFYTDLQAESLSLIMNIQDRFFHLKIKLIKIPHYYLEQMKDIQTIYTQLPLATYYRLFIPELLPHLDRVLYMDIDMVVLKNLDVLYYTEFEGNYLVAVPDLPMNHQLNYWGENLLGQFYNSYFNNGLLLMNLKLMRQNRHLEKLLKFIGENYHYFLYDDQDAFNIYYRGAVKYFPPTYNWTPFNYMIKDEEIADIAVMHFCGPEAKPWQNNSYLVEPVRKLKNYYRMTKLYAEHQLNYHPKVALFTNYRDKELMQRHKLESMLMQLETNTDIYILFNQNEVDNSIYYYNQFGKSMHLIKKEKDVLRQMKNILEKHQYEYVYCLFGIDYLDSNDVIHQLVNVAEDYHADIVFSTYKRLDEANGSFIFYNADGRIYPVLPDEYESYKQRDFDNLQSLQGLLIRSSLLLEGMNETTSSASELMSKILAKSPQIYYKDSHFWIHKIKKD